MALTIELTDEQTAALKVKAEAQGISPEEYLRQVVDRDLEAARPRQRHISEVIREIWADIPPEDLASLPSDGASEHDHYIYGLPKKNQ